MKKKKWLIWIGILIIVAVIIGYPKRISNGSTFVGMNDNEIHTMGITCQCIGIAGSSIPDGSRMPECLGWRFDCHQFSD
jgi:hypothetical protein